MANVTQPPSPGWVSDARVARVVDADTVVVEIVRTLSVRLAGCRAIERKGAKADAGKKSLGAILPIGSPCRVRLVDGAPVSGETFGEIWSADGTSAAAHQCAAGVCAPR